MQLPSSCESSNPADLAADDCASSVAASSSSSCPCSSSVEEAGACISPASTTLQLHYPRSSIFRSILSLKEYFLLSSKADYSDSSWNFASDASTAGHRYKSFVEFDRICAAGEQRYISLLTKMEPQTCTPKNDVLLGLPNARWRNSEGRKSAAGTQLPEDARTAHHSSSA